jgi:N-acetylglutamate synthase-like GNAT family acetyltransferase
MDDDYTEKVREHCVFVVGRGGVAGLIVLITAADHLLIENLAVGPDRQGTGIGRALMAYAESYAHQHGLRELRLYTNVAMLENLTLYSHLGYTEIARRTEAGFSASSSPRPRHSHPSPEKPGPLRPRLPLDARLLPGVAEGVDKHLEQALGRLPFL